VPLWFSIERPSTPDDPSRARPYDREHHLKQFWFDLFAVDDNGWLLPYEDMLFYMAAVPNPLHGFYRALAIGERTAMPVSKARLTQVPMNCPTLSTHEYERLLDVERAQTTTNNKEDDDHDDDGADVDHERRASSGTRVSLDVLHKVTSPSFVPIRDLVDVRVP
jgi:hypothetical protein